MKKALLPILLIVILASKVYAQAPELNYYAQMGFSAGYATGEYKGGPTLGLVHGTVISDYWFYEASACQLAFFNEGSKISKFTALNLLTMDIGFGYAGEKFFIGLSPCSINLTQSSSIGLAVLSKFTLFENYVIEGKIMPKLYGKPEDYGMLNNNFYTGVHYWFSDFFSLGLRYTRSGYFRGYNVMASWNFL